MSLPPSSIDPEDYPSGPTGMAQYLVDRIDELEGLKLEATCREERRPINQALHRCRDMLRWCRSRAGYDPRPQDPEPIYLKG
jgi:hypothetical protein